MDSSATELTISVTVDAANDGVMVLDDFWTDAPYNNEVTSWAQFNSLMYMACGKNLFKANAGQTAFTYVDSFFREISQLQVGTVSGVDYLFIMFKGWDYALYQSLYITRTVNVKDLTIRLLSVG